MPLQNRVLPDGQIVAISARGTMTGNRGIIHRADQTLGVSRWSHHAWICCTLDWQGRKRQVMTGRNWTELFFLDEAVAFAAGHRPCGYCRRDAYARFQSAWGDAMGKAPRASEMDRVLHAARMQSRSRLHIQHSAAFSTLPDGTIVQINDAPHLILGPRMLRFTATGYDSATQRPMAGTATVMTPKPTVAVLRAGYDPELHPSAHQYG